MKPLLFILTIGVLMSCTSADNTGILGSENVKAISLTNAKYSNFLGKIDSLNQIYYGKTKEITRASGFERVCVGFFSAAIDGIAGSFLVPGGPAAVFIGGTAASLVYNEWWDHCSRRGRTRSASDAISSDIILPKCDIYVFSDENYMPTQVDSAGLYHNQILMELQRRGKQYVDDDNNIDMISLLNDCQEIAMDLGLENTIFSNSLKELMASLINESVEAFKECTLNDSSLNNAYDRINNYYRQHETNFENIIITEQVQSKVLTVLSTMNENQLVKDYADDINRLVIESCIEPDTKDIIRTSANMTVNSKLYWQYE